MTSPDPRSIDRSADPLSRARGLAVVGSGGVVVASTLGWGRPGLVAGACGAGLSLLNAWALSRFANRAALRAAAQEPNAATVELTSALGAKTAVLLAAVWLLTRNGKLEMIPFALGLLVSVLSLLGAGLWSALSAATTASMASRASRD
jgi:hypothetical protein